MFFTVFSLLELFFSCCKIPAIVLIANFQRIQMLRHQRLALDWLSVSFICLLTNQNVWFVILLCTELTLFCTELPENCIYLNQLELSNFFIYIINKEMVLARLDKVLQM